jgi:sterol desaturase/sphingolipid hydroxylase (fatty acid hydroxylase superfamily)
VTYLVSRTAYPAILVLSLLLSALALHRGMPPGAVVTGAILGVLVVVSLLERALPFTPGATPLRETRADLVYLVIAAVLQPVGRALGQLLATGVTLALVSAIPPSSHAWPLWARVLLAAALSDLGKYALHRAAHEHPWLWRFHAEHHAPSRMVALNGIRLHPVNLLWNLTLDAVPALALGLDAKSIALLGVFRGSLSVLQHANVELRLGPLDWIFSTPTVHRWHHSTNLTEATANYGSSLIVWDVLLGTRRVPKDRRAPRAVGLAPGTVHPSGLRHELLWPWCGARRATCRLVRGAALRSPDA